MTTKTGIELIAQERKEQIEKHGYSVETDVEYYQRKELHRAAVYALTYDDNWYPESWGLNFKSKMEEKRNNLILGTKEFEIERLKIAGALIAAEIDRLQTN